MTNDGGRPPPLAPRFFRGRRGLLNFSSALAPIVSAPLA